MELIRFRHAHFSARFPAAYRYSPAHFWMAPLEGPPAGAPVRWRVGFTKFATRMLGELVEIVLDVEPGAAITAGMRLGSVEGFKAVSDLVSVIDGRLLGDNPQLTSEACLTHSDPYGAGWLYAAAGELATGHLDVHGYIAHLQETIDRLQASRYSDGG